MKVSIPQTFRLMQMTRHELLLFISWILTALVVFVFIFGAWCKLTRVSTDVNTNIREFEPPKGNQSSQIFSIPVFNYVDSTSSIHRLANIKTEVDTNINHEVISYSVEKGDSIFKISKQFNIKPETILWANPETLNDNPEFLTIGMNLNIPPTDGIYYKWKTGDSVADVAARFKVKPFAILVWPENGLDISNPVIKPGSYIMVPGGIREMISWVMPTIPRGNSGVSTSLAGPGACNTTDGANGTGTFVWPSVIYDLSGNDFWSGHLALDISSNMGSPVFASDSGLVVYAGWNNTGYGNMVMIDHGNGYQTLYAHLSQISVSCGSSVYQGYSIGSSGNSGNSTGPHLHFETRYMGGLLNPRSVLP